MSARTPAAGVTTNPKREDVAAVLERALRIEAIGGRWTVEECAAVLRLSTRTVHRHPQLRALFKRGIGKRVTLDPKDVRELQRRTEHTWR